MADIELIIKIPEEIRLLLINGNLSDGQQTICDVCIQKAIRNGTIIPKGHGRLIDADELKKHKYRDNDRYENAVAVAQIDWADTIIEANKGKK